ncbi:phospholipid carrier-dependent glycosyltransferase [Glycocaulis profundi]|nr:phospholipid carrier-dependent glycosyltransferase [Glycocaulis profundi]
MTPVPPLVQPDPAARNWVLAALAIGLGLLVFRLAALWVSPVDLYADETQYWIWSRALDWGYFSKPPLIAWIIAATTAMFGDSDFAVRLAAPILHTVTAAFLGLAAARLFGARAGAATAIAWLTLPSVWLSASIISTDAPLLAFWSVGLYALVRLREGAGPGFALLLGAAAGFAFLAKYAAIYFLVGVGFALIVDGPARRALLGLKGTLAGLVMLAIIAPNIAWNAANSFATVSHTAANANWGADLFNPGEAVRFVTSQLGVFGPAFFIALILAVVLALRAGRGASDSRPLLMLALFSAPAVLVVAGQAFISRAHANWAASAYAAGLILVVALLMEGARWRRGVLIGSIALHSVAGLAFIALAASPALTEQAGLSNAFKRVRGWEETARQVEAAAAETGAAAIAFDNRNDFHQMQRYAPTLADRLYMWMRYGQAINQAEHTWPLPAGFAEPVLIVSERPREIPLIAADFAALSPAGEIAVPLGGGRERRYGLFIAEGYAPLPRTESYEQVVADMRGETEPTGD